MANIRLEGRKVSDGRGARSIRMLAALSCQPRYSHLVECVWCERMNAYASNTTFRVDHLRFVHSMLFSCTPFAAISPPQHE